VVVAIIVVVVVVVVSVVVNAVAEVVTVDMNVGAPTVIVVSETPMHEQALE
jgi:hypothetical protein